MKIGEIYFIRERDRVDGATSSYVKIGLINDASTRDSSERLSDHQTGNPRDLELHHVTQTPSPYRVEKFLHQRFGAKRVRNEWFALEDDDLDEAVRISEQIAEDAFQHLAVIEEADRLKVEVSIGAKLPVTPESIDWHRRLMTSKGARKVCSELRDAYRSVFHEMTPEQRQEIELEELVLSEQYLESRFDENGFASKYPTLFERFTTATTSITGRFVPAKLDTVELEHELMKFRDQFTKACEHVAAGMLDFGQLFDHHRELETFDGAYEWDETIADAHLRALCGTAPGIEGLCSWNRTVKETSEFDKEGLESNHPNEYREFLTTTVRTRTKTKKRARRAR